MADNLGLDHDEIIILKETNVATSNTLIPMYTNDLILTNKKIIYLIKNMFGGTKKTFYYPLDQIKSYNGVPQVQQGKSSSSGTLSLDIYMLNGEAHFSFESKNKKKIATWIEEIRNLFGVPQWNEMSENTNNDDSIIGAFKDIGEEFKDTGIQIAEAFGFSFKSKKKNNSLSSHIPTNINLANYPISSAVDDNSVGDDGIRCASCGKILPPGSLFCTECGAAVAVPVADEKQHLQTDGIVCPSCGKRLAPGLRFCTECGAEIKISNTGNPEPQNKTETETTTSEKLTIEQQIELLQKLKSLLDTGIISQEEFEKKKKEIL